MWLIHITDMCELLMINWEILFEVKQVDGFPWTKKKGLDMVRR